VRAPLLAAVVCLTALVAPVSAAPGGIPVGPGGTATSNVRLLTNLPTGTGTGGGFLGTTYFQTSTDASWFWATRTTPMAPVTGGLLAFDASNPEQPVVTGALPIPHHENEDLSLSESRKLAVISQQPYQTNPLMRTSWQAGTVYLVDVSNPSAMTLAGLVQLPAEVGTDAETGEPLHGPGHTATLVGGDQYLWVSGSRDGKVWVVDIRDLTAPTVLGAFTTPAGRATPAIDPGLVHDVDVDPYGDVWVTGSGGTAMYELTADPLQPRLIAAISEADNLASQQALHHGSQRLTSDVVLVTEEDYQGTCDSAAHQDGALQAWRIDRATASLTEVSDYDVPAGSDASGFPIRWCSSHWFTINSHDVVADAWYSAGVRFLDYSDPALPRAIGVWRGDGATASQARFVPGRPDLVYVADYSRGLDVVQIDDGGAGAATMTAQPETADAVTGLSFPVKLRPDADFGWACAVPVSG